MDAIVPHTNFLLLVLIALALVALLLFGSKQTRWLDFRMARAVPPPQGSPSLPRRYIRLAECVALVVSGGLVWFLTAANTQRAGYLLHLSGLPHSVVVAQVALALVALALIIAGAFAAWHGRSAIGTVIVAVAVLGYGFTLDNCSSMKRVFNSRASVIPDTLYVLNVGDNLPGAEVWVNDVYLGRTPIRIRSSELQQKVPLWSQESDMQKLNLPKPAVAVPAPGDIVHDAELKWTSFSLPYCDPGTHSISSETEFTRYYARIRFSGEWTAPCGSSGGGGNDEFSMSFGAEFPLFEARERHLLDLARLADYRPGAQWFQAIETYGPHGWKLLERAASSEDGMRQVADQWVARRYGLDEVKDASAAWAVFERIGREADTADVYSTAGMEGRAVERIAPLLDPDRLVRRAEEWLAADVHSYRYGSADGRPGFLVQAVPETQMQPGERALRPQDGELAHAIWLLDQRLDAEGAAHPNLVEERIVPALLRHNPRGDFELRAAVALGGPVLDRYLWRQNWRRFVVDNFSNAQDYTIQYGGVFINRWALLLASLPTAVGRGFRQQHQSELISMTDKIMERAVHTDGVDPALGYLFLDNDLGKTSLAAAYWPRYREKTRVAMQPPWSLRSQWEYLARMEPLPTVKEYVECWTSTKESELWAYSASRALRSLPPEKHRAVLQAIRDLLPSEKRENWTDALSRVAAELWRISPELQAKSFIQEAQMPENRQSPDFRDWLEGKSADDSVVKILAAADTEQGRELACRRIEANPVPANRALLPNLLADPAPEVRAKAQATAKALDQLAKTPPADFAYPINAER